MQTKPVLALMALAGGVLLMSCGDEGGPTLQQNNTQFENNENNALKPDGSSCASGDECIGGSCVTGKCTSASCIDGAKNGDESDIDCGAIGCTRCAVGKTCDEDLDCVSGICNDGVCRDKNCGDSIKNGLETDVDCGFLCGPCDDGKACNEVSDCVSEVCSNNVCLAPTCSDTKKNGTETDVDCGGPCEPCGIAARCSVPADCDTGVCTDGVCQAPVCTDAVKNGTETAVDCGGRECGPCDDGAACAQATDCVSGVCDPGTRTCSTASCDDRKLNGIETDVDCGGDCPPCAPTKRCDEADDCVSGICDVTKLCSTPTCTDMVQNGDETGLDCGGRCGGCPDGAACVVADDCTSLVCTGNICQAGQCSDGQLNGTETDVDCGSNCNDCADNKSCLADTDCLSNSCRNNRCAAATCTDTKLNGSESDIDCGGSCQTKCDPGERCNYAADCESNVCGLDGLCQASTCQDGVQNQDETDIDCGGLTCEKCELGDSCGANLDCESNICGGGAAGPICAECVENQKQTTTRTCGYLTRGQVQQTCLGGFWADTACVNVWYGSCKELLQDKPNTLDGNYTLDPDGPATGFPSFTAFCDMTTDGGGWTDITPCIAKDKLNAELVALQTAKTSTFENCRPKTQDEAGGHAYHWTFDFPSGYREFYFKDYEAKANAAPNNTSDLGWIQTSWTQQYSGNNMGDIAFGTPFQAGPTYSYSRFAPGSFSNGTSCNSCVQPWPGQATINPIGGTSTKFRIAWSEVGPEFEGWYPWWTGSIRLR